MIIDPNKKPDEIKSDIVNLFNAGRFQGHGYSKFLREWSGNAKDLNITFSKESGAFNISAGGTSITLYPEGKLPESQAKTAALPKWIRNVKAYHDREAHAGLDGRVKTLAKTIVESPQLKYEVGMSAKQPEPKLQLLKDAAGRGHSKAGYELGAMYDLGKGVNKDIHQAINYYQKAAENGDKGAIGICAALKGLRDAGTDENKIRRAEMVLGKAYLNNGDNVGAIVHFENAAELGSSGANYELGKIYENRDMNVAIEYYKKANTLEAYNRLGNYYRIKDPDQALVWFNKAAAKSPAAQIDIGNIYRNRGDFKTAIENYEKAGNFGRAQYELGNLYLEGKGVEKDPRKAFECFEAAAGMGDLKGIEKWQELEEKGNKAYQLGDRLERHSNDLEKAIESYQEAAAFGNVKASLALGNCYETGRGVPQNKEEAVKYYKLAADRGNIEAKNSLARISDERVGPEHIQEVIQQYLAADNPSAMFQLGDIYERGRPGVPIDMKKAIEYFEIAAKYGNAEAAMHLGDLYREGKGVEKDLLKAIAWYQNGATNQANSEINKLIRNNRLEIVQQLRRETYFPESGEKLEGFQAYNTRQKDTKLLSDRIELVKKLLDATPGDSELNGELRTKLRDGKAALKTRNEAIKQMELEHPHWVLPPIPNQPQVAQVAQVAEVPIAQAPNRMAALLTNYSDIHAHYKQNPPGSTPFTSEEVGKQPFSVKPSNMSEREKNLAHALKNELGINPNSTLENFWMTSKMMREYMKLQCEGKDLPDNNLQFATGHFGAEINPENLEAYLENNVDGADTKNIPFRFHLGGNHWTFVYIDQKKRTVEFYDSMGTSFEGAQESLNRAAEQLSAKFPGDMPFEVQNKITNACQRNGVDCGPWTMFFMLNRISNPEVDFNSIGVSRESRAMVADFRNHIVKASVKMKLDAMERGE